MIRACDQLFTGGIVFLIVFTPFAFGAVHPLAYSTMEVVIFALVVVAMVKLLVLRRQNSAVGDQWEPVSSHRSSSTTLTPVVLPLALFIILCALQLVPLPPSFLQVISPQTFETYRQILPGWPERMPYAEIDELVRGVFSPLTFMAPVNLRHSFRACDSTDMRLSIVDAKSIRQCVLRFDPKAEVFLFGSRADDTRRGGDIDLLIFSKRIGLRERLRLQSALEDALGLRKIDLVIVDNVDNSPFARSVQPGSVRL